MEKNIDDLLMEYALKFEDTPPLPYSMNYDDEPIVAAIKKALKTGEKLTLESYGDVGEGVILN